MNALECVRVWRNFRYKYGDVMSGDASMSSRRDKQENAAVPENVASLYPVTIPSPSHVGEFTFSKFLTETPVIKNQKLQLAVLRQVQKDNEEFQRLRLRSELRDPPLTQSGNSHISLFFIPCLTCDTRVARSGMYHLWFTSFSI